MRPAAIALIKLQRQKYMERRTTYNIHIEREREREREKSPVQFTSVGLAHARPNNHCNNHFQSHWDELYTKVSW